MSRDFTDSPGHEAFDTLLNPHRDAEQDAAKAAGAVRLQALGIRLFGTETSNEIGDMLDAVERFERAVEARDGDLMVDEGPHGHTLEPDNPEFVLPARTPHEPAAAFITRLDATTEQLRRRRK